MEDDTIEVRAARRAWVSLIKKISELDPLICPECSSPVWITHIIEELDVIVRIPEQLKLWEERSESPAGHLRAGRHSVRPLL